MKRSIIIYCIAIGFFNNVNSQIVDIPDPNFKVRLLEHEPVIDTNEDGEIQHSEAEAFHGALNVSGSSSEPGEIQDITGIEAFINIHALNCEYNQIATLVLTYNVAMETLICNYSGITELDISNNSALRTLSASGNLFESINLSNNTNLEFFQCNSGQLSSLNTNQNPLLQYLYVQGNSLTQLDLSNNPLLVGLIIDNNEIDELNIVTNNNLNFVYCRNNLLSELDLSNQIELVTLDCKDNSLLEFINLKNGANENLNISGGSQSCNFENLPLLDTVCLDAINSDLATFISSHVGHQVQFIEDCNLGIDDLVIPGIRLFPIPFDEELYILSNIPVIEVVVYNLLGKIVYTFKSNKSIIELSMSNLISGVYIIKMEDLTNRQSIQKIIKK